MEYYRRQFHGETIHAYTGMDQILGDNDPGSSGAPSRPRRQLPTGNRLFPLSSSPRGKRLLFFPAFTGLAYI